MSQSDGSSPRRFALTCDDGATLRAELFQPRRRRTPSAVVCHPHPLHGGTMYNHVVSILCRALVEAGSFVLRFNFRGTSGSTGSYGRGFEEQRDVEAAIDHLAGVDGDRMMGDRPQRPGVVVAGYSFGADVGLAVDRDDVAGWIAVAPTLSVLPPAEYRARRSSRPVLILTGDRDEFCPPSLARERTAGWAATEIVTLPGENHMLATAQHVLTDQVTRFVTERTERE